MIALLFHDVYVRDPRESGFSSPGADRYKLSVAQFEAQLAGLASACAADRCLATFDDGGVSFHTVVADRLEAIDRRGYCFVTTDCIGQPAFLDASQIRDLDARGHSIGSHTASHPARLDRRSFAEIRREWRRSCDVLEDILGHAVTMASVPGGCLSEAVALAARDAGIATLFTSEPTTRVHFEGECAVVGRFAVRHASDSNLAHRLVQALPLARWGQWTSWNAKRAIKPLLGSSYAHVADWLLTRPGGPSLHSR